MTSIRLCNPVAALFLATLFFSACLTSEAAISESDRLIPGELIVSRGDDRALHVVAANGSASHRVGEQGDFSGLALSPDSRSIAAVQAATNSQPIAVIDITTGATRLVEAPNGSYNSPVWSPSGKALAFAGVDYDRFGTGGGGVYGDQIFIADADGSHVHLLLGSEDDGMRSPTWSSDGLRVAWSDETGVWIANADGAARQQVLAETQILALSWSPAGNTIVVERGGTAGPEIFVVDADSGNVHRIALGGSVSDPAWSPDGRWIALAGQDQSGFRLVLVDPDGVQRSDVPVSKSIDTIHWSPDSMWIAFSSIYAQSDGPITEIHLSVIDPFSEQPRVHTLLRDLSDSRSFAWLTVTR